MTENEISSRIIEAAIDIHKKLGPGLLEKAYEKVLCHVLTERNLKVRRQVVFPVMWEDTRIDESFRADLLVEEKVIVEIKSVEQLAPVHSKQLLTYLRIADKKLGLLLNFNSSRLIDGITRIVNGL